MNRNRLDKLEVVLCGPAPGKCGNFQVCAKDRNMSNNIRDKLGAGKFDIRLLRIVTAAGDEQNCQKHHFYIKLFIFEVFCAVMMPCSFIGYCQQVGGT